METRIAQNETTGRYYVAGGTEKHPHAGFHASDSSDASELDSPMLAMVRAVYGFPRYGEGIKVVRVYRPEA